MPLFALLFLLDPAALQDALRFAAERNSTGVVVVQQGRIAAEQYWKGWDRNTSEPIYSSSKSVASTLVGMAIEDGKIKGTGQSVADFIPAWKGTPKAAITVRHLLTMTSGLKNSTALPGPEADAFETTAAQPLDHAPGEAWEYNSPAYRMLLRIVELATGESLPAYTKRKLTGPLEMANSKWDSVPAPGGRVNWTWFSSSLRDMAQFGLLALHGGEWKGKQLIGAAWLREATSPSQELNPAYGYSVVGEPRSVFPPGPGPLKEGRIWPDVPPDAFGALGAMDKKIYVVPSLDLVVARHGPAAGGKPGEFDNEFLGRDLPGSPQVKGPTCLRGHEFQSRICGVRRVAQPGMCPRGTLRASSAFRCSGTLCIRRVLR